MRTGDTEGASGERAISMKGKGSGAPWADGQNAVWSIVEGSKGAPLETPLKTLIDKFRGAKPEWQHADPAVRAEAVLRLGANERETILAIAREDVEARVRRAAVKKLFDVAPLAERAREDTDEGVRDEAGSRLAGLAIHGQEAAAAEAAVKELIEARHLATVAKSGALASVRLAAVARISEAKHLGAVVRECEDNATRLAALSRLEDQALLLSFALKSEHRAVALAAVERIADRDGLEAVAARARVSAAGRRAKARLDGLLPREAAAEAPFPPPPADMDETEAYERARADQEKDAAERARRSAEREALCAAVEQAEGDAVPAVVEQSRAAWDVLEPLAGAEGELAGRRFEASISAAEGRHASFLGAADRRSALEALCTQAEDLAVSEDLPAARAGLSALEAKWTELAGPPASPEAAALRPRVDGAHERLRAREAQTREERARAEKDNLSRLVALGERLEKLAKAEGPSLRDVDHALREAKDALENPGALPSKRDREAALPRLESARKALYPVLQQLREDTEWKRWANVAVQEELCVKAEALLEAKDLEQAAVALRDLDARWKQAREAPKEKGETLWNRFRAARDQVKARCDAYFAKQAAELAANLKAKQALCEQAEALGESTDWLKTAEELKRLQAEWKATGPVARAQSEAIWRRFRKPADQFFARRKENQGQREKEWAQNLAKKTALCEQAEAVRDSTDWDATAAELKRLQGEWKSVGAVRKNKSDAIWERFRKASDHYFERYKDRDNLERQAAVGARETLLAELSGLAPAEGAAEVGEAPPDLAARVQAAQGAWRQAGEVSREQLESLTDRFNLARNRLVEIWPAAFQGTDLDMAANQGKAEKLCARAEEVLAQVGPEPTPSGADIAERIKNALASNTIGGAAAVEAKWESAAAEIEAAQVAWQRIGPLPGEAGRELAARFEATVRRFKELRPRVVAPRASAPERRDRGDRADRGDRPGRGDRGGRGDRPDRPGSDRPDRARSDRGRPRG
jgi:Domain of Unknown Function (DUF349)